jgi:hypothetical protein
MMNGKKLPASQPKIARPHLIHIANRTEEAGAKVEE